MRRLVGSQDKRPASFRTFEATELFCNRCRSAQPVRERLLLVLPDGELFEYLCADCGAAVGTRKAESAPPASPHLLLNTLVLPDSE